jgi:hypothetical protein
MLPIDPGDDPGSSVSGRRPPESPGSAPDGMNRDRTETIVVPAPAVPGRPLRDILPPAAMPRGGTIIRPGAVAWRGLRVSQEAGYSSCETIERSLAAVVRNPGELPSLLAELAVTRLWVPLPVRRRPFTDGSAVLLPLIGYQGAEFVPCFTSVQRLTTWAERAEPRRAGDPRDVPVPHVVIRADGLAQRLPSGFGLALNPDNGPGLPLYPECVPFLARFGTRGQPGESGPLMDPLEPGDSELRIGHPPAEPTGLLAAARAALRPLPAVRQAARAWLAVPGQGEGLLFAVTVKDPASQLERTAVTEAIERAVTAAALRAPFPVYVVFPGEPVSPSLSVTAPRAPRSAGPIPLQSPPAPHASGRAHPFDPLDAWIAANTRPFYVSG